MAKNLPLIDSTGLVINVIHLEDGAEWTPPDGHTLGIEGGAIGDTWDGAQYVKPSPPTITKADLAAYAADKRYRVMCSGISFGGVTIPGDDISQLRIGRARDDLASHVLTEPISVNLGLVSIQATAAQITAIANGLSVKTQAAWTVQGTVIAAINAETITTTAQIDAAPWPSNG